MTDPPSGKLYTAVTKYWPRIAAGLVGLVAVAEMVLGATTPGFTIGFYVFAWATATGGVWFLFETAEKALSQDSRVAVVRWVRDTDLRASIESIPAQFRVLFDHIFGERHLAPRCFYRSCLATLVALSILLALEAAGALALIAQNWEVLEQQTEGRPWLALLLLPVIAFGMLAVLGILNFVPDYLSLLETRWMLRLMEGKRWFALLLLGDLIFTTILSAGAMFAITMVAVSLVGASSQEFGEVPPTFTDFLFDLMANNEYSVAYYFVIPFYSAFFTSVWLWLYALSVPLSRLLLRMNSGVGFLLRVTDVERQPFRSMGFVSVIILSVLFALGLPLVLL